MKHFLEFIDQKTREARRQLTLIRRILEQKGMEAEALLDDLGEEDEPYVFVKAPNENLSFHGIRIYKVGDNIAYRVVKEKDTQPYGKAFPLEVEEMFEDLIGDRMNEEIAGKRVMEAICGEVEKFFQKCVRAEQDINMEKNKSKFVLKGSIDYGAAVSHASL
jgi:hypothetical protein